MSCAPRRPPRTRTVARSAMPTSTSLVASISNGCATTPGSAPEPRRPFAKTAPDLVDDVPGSRDSQERQETVGSGSKAGQSAAWGHRAPHGRGGVRAGTVSGLTGPSVASWWGWLRPRAGRSDDAGHRLRESGRPCRASGGSTGPSVGRILVEREVSSRPVIVRNVQQSAYQHRLCLRRRTGFSLH